MKTIIFLIRHSTPIKDLIDTYKDNDTYEMRNMHAPLSKDGDALALLMSQMDELNNIDKLISSSYLRSIETAKYIAFQNHLKITIDSRFNERNYGVSNLDELTKDFFIKQLNDLDYKLENGESFNDAYNRLTKAFDDVLNNYQGKRIAIVSHGKAISVLLKKWCDVKYTSDFSSQEIYFNDQMVFDGKWHTPELFKLEFEDKNLINIVNIKINGRINNEEV